MRPVASTVTEHSTLEGEERQFTVSQVNQNWVMRSMADLYSNRELAVIREYSTNAWDANLEAARLDGVEPRPIEVSLPTVFNPQFVVQDHGRGMSREEMLNVYTVFGDSTKRDNDEANGLLGFGSKSGIAYTNSFTATSVNQGRKVCAVINRREDEFGGYEIKMKIVLDQPTDEPSGVRIEIPVHNAAEFMRKAQDFYRFWLPGRVLLNGRAPEWAVGEKVDDNLYYYPHAGTSYVVMGNVPYRIANPDALFPNGMNKISFVAYVPMGAVEFTPSREDLKYSEHTKKNLHAIIEDFTKKSVDKAKAEISGASSHAEAYEKWKHWRGLLGAKQVEDLEFKGDKFVAEFPLSGWQWEVNRARYNTTMLYDGFKFQVSDAQHAIFVTDFAPTSVNSSHRGKAKQWAALKGLHGNYPNTLRQVFFTRASKIDCVWIDQSRVVKWEDLKAALPKKPRSTTYGGYSIKDNPGSFDLITKDGLKGDRYVPDTKQLYYVSTDESKRFTVTYLLEGLGLDWTVVIVPANRTAKFLRNYPHAQRFVPAVEKLVVLDGDSLVSEEAKKYHSLSYNYNSSPTILDPNKINDPELAADIRRLKNPPNNTMRKHDIHKELAYALRKGHQFKAFEAKNKRHILENYPLLTTGGWLRNMPKDHVYLYINAAYAERKKNDSV